MVKAVLKPIYKKRTINTQEYTDVNMQICRMLYDRIGDDGGLADDAAREKWQAVAAEEVEAASMRLGRANNETQPPPQVNSVKAVA